MNAFYADYIAMIKLLIATGVLSKRDLLKLVKEAKEEGIQLTQPLGWAPDGRKGSVTGFVSNSKSGELTFDKNGKLRINLVNPSRYRDDD